MERQDASMPTILAWEAAANHEIIDTERVPALPVSKSHDMPQPMSDRKISKLEAALTRPGKITIQKSSIATTAPRSFTTITVPAVKKIVGTPVRHLQFLCEDGRVVRPITSPSASEPPLPPSSSSAAPEEQPETSAGAATEALETAPADPAVSIDRAGMVQSEELVPGTPPPDPGYWVVQLENADKPADTQLKNDSNQGDEDWDEDWDWADVGQEGAGDKSRRLQVCTDSSAHLLAAVSGCGSEVVASPPSVAAVEVATVAETVSTPGSVETPRTSVRVKAAPRRSRLGISTPGSLVKSCSAAASAVLDAVESAAAVSHVVFEPDGRAVGALVPAPDRQRAVLAGQQGDQQVVLAVDGGVLGTDRDGDQVVLQFPQVDQAKDPLTLIVNRVGKERFEVAPDGGELLELWERDSEGKDRHVETVTEVSLVDIRAMCEQCGCVISHHMVGLLTRKDGSEYGYRCRLCQFVQADVDVMARHMDSHRPMADTQCRFCSRGLNTFKPQLSRIFTCHACGKVFRSRSEMLVHRQLHPLKMRFPCELCDKAFQMKAQLEVHMRTHLGHKPYSCDMCPAAFTQPSHLINHRRTHTGERPYSCEHCGRAFVQQGHLRAHERTHTGERPYKCDFCGRCFRQSGQLTAHKKLHEGDEPVKFRRRHDDPISPDEKVCPECGKTFKKPKDVKRHMLIHGKGEYICHVCDRNFKRRDHLKRHLLSHENPKRKRRRPACPYGQGQQSKDLLQLDRVIDAILDEPGEQENVRELRGAHKFQKDHKDPKVKEEEVEDAGDVPDLDEVVDDFKSESDEDHDDKSRVLNIRVSGAPEDVLWSQPDGSDDVRWQRAERGGGRRPAGGAAYLRRRRLHQTPVTDDGVDDEMAMLAAALKEREVARKLKRDRGVTCQDGHSPEPTVKLQPANWADWGPGDNTTQGKRDAYPGDEDWDEDWDWADVSQDDTGDKSGRMPTGAARRGDDLVLSVWDDVDLSEDIPAGTALQSGRPKGLTETSEVLRTSRRSTAGNWAANVGVRLSRNSQRGGRR